MVAKELGASSFPLGMIIAAFSVTRGLLFPVVGNLSDRLGKKGDIWIGGESACPITLPEFLS
jgi:MFS transporter, DHA1 family, multidrug resistance protein